MGPRAVDLNDIRPGALLIGGVVIGAVTGGVLGYYLGQRSNRRWYEERAVAEIESLRTAFQEDHDERLRDMQTHFDAKHKALEAQLKAPITEVVEYLGYVKKEEVEEEEQPDQTPHRPPSIEDTRDNNVFQSNPAVNDDWDYDLEFAWRHENPGRPYVIHLDEYGEEGYDPVSYTYYTEDHVVADEHDEAIDNVDELIGLENLEKFGHGSDNANIVMVRNEALTLDIEVAKCDGSYAADVQGFLQHSQHDVPIPRRRQGFDDD
jgi:hypothetical protein